MSDSVPASWASLASRWTDCSAVESCVSWFARTSRVGGDVDVDVAVAAEVGAGTGAGAREGVLLPLVVVVVVFAGGARWAS